MAIADLSNPKVTQDYTTLLQSIRDLFSSQAALHDATGIVGAVAGAIRYSGANSRLEKFDGTTWNALPIVLTSAQVTGGLGYTPVQQGSGIGQGANVVKLGWGSAGGGLKATIDTTDYGYLPLSSTNPTSGGAITYANPVVAASFAGGGSGLTGFTSGQITGALGFTPYNATNPSGYISNVATALGYTPYNAGNPAGYLANGTGSFSPGQVTEVGRYFDFHGTTNANDFDVRFDCGPTGAAAAGTMTVTCGAFNISGSMSAATVTQTSDARKKQNWHPITNAQLDALAGMEHAGTFDWIADGAPSVGGSAQEIQRIIPQAVHADAEGNLTVNYGGLNFAVLQALLRRGSAT
jgi:hypothetical protein